MSFSPTAIAQLLRRHYPKSINILQQLIEAMQFTRTQGVKLTDIDIINRIIPLRSKVKVYDEILGTKLNISGGYPTYIPATEPNGTSNTLYLFLDHAAEIYRDHSGFGNDATLAYSSGQPDLDKDGPDLGNGMASRALKFDSTKNMTLTVLDSTTTRINNLTTGFSLTIRFRLSSLANQGGTMRRFWVKRDDANYSVLIGVDSSGKLEVHIEWNNVTTRWETTNNEVTANDWYTATIVYTITGPALAVYVTKDGVAAGAAKALTSGIGSRGIFDETANLIIGSFDNGAYGTFNGTSDTRSQADSAALDLTTAFSIAVKFRTYKNNLPSTFTYMLAKGDFTIETAGQNLNYYLIVNNANKVSGGFETSAGTNNTVTSPLKYNDGLWHYAVLTYDSTTLKLYIDGVLVASLLTSAVPDTNSAPLYLGSHQGTSSWFQGNLDECRVWNIALTQTDVTNLLADTIQATGLVFEEDFGATGSNGGGFVDGNIQFVLFERDVLYSASEAQAIANNKWTRNTNVGSNKVAQPFYTLAPTT